MFVNQSSIIFSYRPFDFKYTLHRKDGSRWRLQARDRRFEIEVARPGGEAELTETRAFCHEELRTLLFQEVLKARGAGYTLPQALTQEELFARETVPAADLDIGLEGDQYEKVLLFDGDLRIEGDLNLLTLYDHADALMVRGDLIVNGGVYNPEGDYGAGLHVMGNLLTDFLVVGGSEVRVDKKVFAHVLVLKYYNHGRLDCDYDSLDTSLLIDEEPSDISYGEFRWYDMRDLLLHTGVHHDFVGHFDEDRTPPPEGTDPWSQEMGEYLEDARLEPSTFIQRLVQNDYESGRMHLQELLFSALPGMIEEGSWR